MKTNVLRIIWIGLTLLYVFGCSGPASLQKETSTLPPQQRIDQTRLIEEFDPLTLNDEPAVNAESAREDANFYKLSDFIDSEAQDTTDANEMAPGYRVQLISTRSESESRMVKLDAMLTFQTHVYLIFDNPYYKIRIGDCLSRYEANDLQDMAVKKGFSEAWVVKTNVYRKARPVDESK